MLYSVKTYSPRYQLLAQAIDSDHRRYFYKPVFGAPARSTSLAGIRLERCSIKKVVY
jgi:hypothetical protein